MKQLNITYEDKEFQLIEKVKKKYGEKNWHDTILEWAKYMQLKNQEEGK